MQKKSYIYFISAVILVTLVIQVYWNFKNYQASKQQLINEIQISLDNAVDQYYENLAKDRTVGFASESGDLGNFLKSSSFDSILKDIDTTHARFKNLDFLDSTKIDNISIFRGKDTDTIDRFLEIIKMSDHEKTVLKVNNHDTVKTSINNPFEVLTSKIVISINQDTLEMGKIDSLFQKELGRKKVFVDYGIKFSETHKLLKDNLNKAKILYPAYINPENLTTTSKSAYLPSGGKLQLYFTNTTQTILKKNLIGISLSFLLLGSVIGCLLYLLKIINHQKQLAALKNDLISNITHEFKTPIATISAALEAIQNFNQENDPAKTKKYLKMSTGQLSKLNTMVEKILETATLDSDELQLNLEETNLTELTQSIIHRYETNFPEKNITFESSHKNIWKNMDVFHLENALNNVVDNAIKYGGDQIGIFINKNAGSILIEIKDSGTTLTKAHQDKIFKKFYRVPKGNTHDIKGFGIGLFYTKTIIEKHNGTIQLALENRETNFKITFPND